MKILAVGDLVGENGVEKLKRVLPKVIDREQIDFVIVNAENSAGGSGITGKIFEELKELKIDVITMGNHTWGKKDIFTFIDEKMLLRPANYSRNVPGHGYEIFECKNKKICVVNLIGRTEMGGVQSDNPFTKMDDILEQVRDKVDIIVVDFHAEATAEKIALSNYLDGRVEIVFGTHTHVQTADEHILPNGTAYITDLGMTGPKNSVIGMEIQSSLKRFLTSIPERYKLASGECMFNGCLFEIDDETNKVTKIHRMK